MTNQQWPNPMLNEHWADRLDDFLNDVDEIPSGPVVPNLILSFTSYPGRLHWAPYTALSLLGQIPHAERVILWLSRDEFPDESLPHRLTRLKKLGLEIRFVDGNSKQFKKLLPALVAFPEATIVTADDDQWYSPSWLQGLLDVAARAPTAIIGHRPHPVFAHENGRLTVYQSWQRWGAGVPEGTKQIGWMCTGVGGILYPPGSLHADASDVSLALEVSPKSDDVWAWANALRKGTEIRPSGRVMECPYVSGGSAKLFAPLLSHPQVTGVPISFQVWSVPGLKDQQITQCIERFDLQAIFDKAAARPGPALWPLDAVL
jgi:hypothetical protein